MPVPSAFGKCLWRIFLLVLVFFVLGYLATLIFFLIEPTSPVENVMVTNITDRQVTISWTTAKPTRGALAVSGTGKFPFLPFFIKGLSKDDTDKGFLRMGFYNTHSVTVENLKPNKGYQYMVYQGWKKVYLANLLTGPTLDLLPNPHPVYGQILKADRKTPAAGVLIYLHTQNAATRSATLSTLTNSEGRWSLDLGNLRTDNLSGGFSLNPETEEIITIQTGTQGRFKARTRNGSDQPWPDIILTGKQ